MFNRFSKLLTCGVTLLLSNVVVAQQQDGWQFLLGAGVVGQQTAWKKMPVQTSAIPVFSASSGPWRIGYDNGNILTYSFVELENFRSYAGVGIRDAGYDPSTGFNVKLSEDPVFQGYLKPDTEVVASVGAIWYWFSLQLAQQVNEEQEALVATLATDIPLVPFQHGGGLSLRLEANYMNEEFTNRIFGVSASNQNIAVGRIAFTPPAATNLTVGLKLEYPYSEQIILMASVSATSINERLQESPLLDEDYSADAMLMLAYRF